MINLSNLKERILFVAWAVPLGWFIINSNFSLLPPQIFPFYPVHLLIIFLIMGSCYEYCKMLSIFYHPNGFWLSYLWLALQFFLLFQSDSTIPSTISLYTLLLIVALEALLWGKQRSRWVRASLLFSGNAFLYIASASMVSLYRQPFQSLFIHFKNPMLSQVGIVIVIGAIFICDTFAYFIGSLWGRHHFTKISPKKTIEGSIGGFIGALLICSVGWFFFANKIYPRWFGIILGTIVGIFAQVGDLLVSAIKRYFRVKDASDIIPGHGGILDRFDSVFFTVPVISLFAWLIHRIFN